MRIVPLAAAATVLVAAGAFAIVQAGPAAAATACTVAWTANSWSTGFTADVRVTNNGAPVTSWTLGWTFAGDQRISSGWSAQLTQSGRYMVAVDTLPAGAAPPQRSAWTPLATRLWRVERENVLGRLRVHGVPVVAWAGAGSLDLVLRDVARMASAPRGR